MSIPLMGDGRDRVDGRAKVTGTARYASENNLPGLVHAVVVADTLEHATHGAELVKIAYDAAPARTDMNALRAEATEKGSQQAPPFVKGDPLGTFATAPVA